MLRAICSSCDLHEYIQICVAFSANGCIMHHLNVGILFQCRELHFLRYSYFRSILVVVSSCIFSTKHILMQICKKKISIPENTIAHLPHTSHTGLHFWFFSSYASIIQLPVQKAKTWKQSQITYFVLSVRCQSDSPMVQVSLHQ